jgi:mRNA export factor
VLFNMFILRTRRKYQIITKSTDANVARKNMSFKCHRDPVQNNTVQVWTINAISTHPVYGTFSTGGSDGTFHFWDKEAKSRLKGYPSVGGSISATAFNMDGTIFAYGVSYDWHKGYAANTPQYPNKVMIHPVSDDEVKPKAVMRKR